MSEQDMKNLEKHIYGEILLCSNVLPEVCGHMTIKPFVFENPFLDLLLPYNER